MGINATPVKTKKPLYSEGKQLARRIFFETMAAIDVGRALRTKVKREGGALVAGNLSLPLLRPPRLVAFGKAAPGQQHPAVYVVGKLGGVYGFYRSDDVGATWVRINDDQHQFARQHPALEDLQRAEENGPAKP